MSGRKEKTKGPKRSGARRRVKARSALLLTLLSALLVFLWRALRATAFSGLDGVAAMLADALVTVAAFALPAALGLLVLDGDQRRLVPLGALSAEQILALTMTGALAVAPLTLLHDVLGMLLTWPQEAVAPMASGRAAALFLPVLLKSALLAPLCEEAFFRGYLLGALAPYGRRAAVLATALLFALMHMGQGMLPCVLLGVLLGALTLRTGSLLAPALVHGCYNLAIVLISFSGLTPLFDRLSLPACALRLAMSAGFVCMLLRAWRARPQQRRAQLASGARMTPGEIARLGAAALLLIAAVVCCLLMPEVKP